MGRVQQPNPDVKLAVLRSRQEEMEAERLRLNEKIQEATRQRARIEEDIAVIKALITDHELRAQAEFIGNHSISRKNIKVHRAWAAVKSEFLDQAEKSDGKIVTLMNKTLFAAVQRALPGIKETTFRSYLSRFKEEGLLDNPISGRWTLRGRR